MLPFLRCSAGGLQSAVARVVGLRAATAVRLLGHDASSAPTPAGRGVAVGATGAGPAPAPTEVKLIIKEKRLLVKFADGASFSYPAELLRVLSPSADTQRVDATGAVRVVSGRRHVGIMSVEQVGNYAVRLHFDDLHHSGIYTWDYLYGLGAGKMAAMRAYLRALKMRGLSRDPPAPRVRARPVVRPGAG